MSLFDQVLTRWRFLAHQFIWELREDVWAPPLSLLQVFEWPKKFASEKDFTPLLMFAPIPNVRHSGSLSPKLLRREDLVQALSEDLVQASSKT